MKAKPNFGLLRSIIIALRERKITRQRFVEEYGNTQRNLGQINVSWQKHPGILCCKKQAL